MRQRLLWTILIVVTVVAALAGPVDRLSEQYAERNLKTALVTFAVSRAMNAVISAAQGSEVALEPGGVGVILSVGEVLDPVNDLVERFSAVMLTAASSLGLQLIILEITGWWGITLALVAAGLVSAAGIWLPRLIEHRFMALTIRFFVALLFVRFAVPLLIVFTTLISDTFLEEQQLEITSALEATTSEIEAISDEGEGAETATDRSFADRIGDLFGSSVESLRIGARLDELRQKASQVSEHIVKLIAIFVLQTILLPIGFLWALLEAMKALAARTARFSVEAASAGGLPR